MTEFRAKYDGLTPIQLPEELHSDIYFALYQHYGADLDPVIAKRVQDEWDALMRSGTVQDAAALYELTLWLRENRIPYWLDAGTGSGFLFYLLGISSGNPLPPHYYCPQCHRVDWDSYIFRDGFDLPDLSCEFDGSPRIRDGHNIPYQMLWGYGRFEGYHIRVVESLLDPLLQILGKHWLCGWGAKPTQKEHLPALIDYASITIECVLNPLEIRSSFYDIEVTADDVNFALWGVETFVNDSAPEKHRAIPHPMDFEDLVANFGLVHSNGAWDNKARCLVKQLGYSTADMIAFRDDVFQYLLDHGFSHEDAWNGMQECCKGHGLPMITDEMQKSRDKWVIDRCESIRYLFPKAHALENILFMMKATPVLPQLRMRTDRLETGYFDIDIKLKGIDRSEIILLAARPGMGKTAFALSVAEHLAVKRGKRVAFFSAENSREVLIKRMKLHGCPETAYDDSTLAKNESICIYDQEGMDFSFIRQTVAPENGIDFIIIDDLQHIFGPKCRDRTVVKGVMQQLRTLTYETGIPALLLSTPLRSADRRKTNKPRASDIPQRQHILPYVDHAMFLYRDAYYDEVALATSAWCKIEKNPRGKPEMFSLIWNSKLAAYEAVPSHD